MSVTGYSISLFVYIYLLHCNSMMMYIGTHRIGTSFILYLSLSLSLRVSLSLSSRGGQWINGPGLPGFVRCGCVRSSLKGLEQFGTLKPKCSRPAGISLTSLTARSPDGDNKW